MNPDEFNLQRFIDAQDGIYSQVIQELQRGEKRSHWMWFIFPQLRGLGYSNTSRFFAISSKDETRAYLDHAILGKRITECCGILLELDGRSAAAIFGGIDELKLASSMTLFANISGPDSIFQQVLDKYFDGEPDSTTLELLLK